jgi:LysM repeat protein
MKIVNWIKVLSVTILLLISGSDLYSQVTVERSKDKVIISGVAYYIHIVKKGETPYSITRAYGITYEQLYKENPPAVYGVNVGQSLRIPVKSVSDVIPAPVVVEQKQHDDTRFIYHKVKPGDTVFSISKAYGVSENEIKESNPGIEISKLPVGSEIAVPRREFMNDRQKFDDQEKGYIYHKVVKGESVSSIAAKYGLTARELRKVNKNLWFPQVDDFVRIPGVKTAETQKTDVTPVDTLPVAAEEPEVKVIPKPAGYSMVKDLKGSLNVAVLLPFYLKENEVRIEIDSSKYKNGKKVYKENKLPDDWMYPGSTDFVEMYEGILLAADTLSSLGLNVILHPYDIKSDTIEITRLINSGVLSSMDLIIGPVYSHNLSKVAEYVRGRDIPVVSPVTLMNNSVLLNNPTLFMANSSLEIAQNALSKKIGEYYNSNLVFIHTDSTKTDEDVKRYKNLIFSELKYKLPYEDIKFKEFLFYSRSMFDNDSINRLSHALSETSKNIVIIASDEAPVISEIIGDVHGLYKKYDINVIAYPVIRQIENLDPKDLFDLDIMLYTPYWIDYSKDNVRRFNANFLRKFMTQPMEKSYAWRGYDIAYFFLSGIAIHGKSFISHPEIHYPELLHTEYNFLRKEPGEGFENQKLFNIRYTKDYEVKLVE